MCAAEIMHKMNKTHEALEFVMRALDSINRVFALLEGCLFTTPCLVHLNEMKRPIWTIDAEILRFNLTGLPDLPIVVDAPWKELWQDFGLVCHQVQ